MDARGWRMPLLGVGGVVLLSMGNELTKAGGGGSPDLHAGAAEYAGSVGTSGLVVLGVWAVVAAWLLLSAFFLVAADALRGDPAGDRAARAVTAGGLLAAAVGISGAAPVLGAWVLALDGELDPRAAKAMLLLNASTFVVAWLVVAVPVGTLAFTAWRRGLLGRALGWSGICIGVALALASLAVWWFGGAMLVWMLTLLWVAAAGFGIARRVPRAGTAAAAVPPAGLRAGAV